MDIIVVLAEASNCGKSYLMTKIIENLPGSVGALKSSVHETIEERIVQVKDRKDFNNKRNDSDTDRYLSLPFWPL